MRILDKVDQMTLINGPKKGHQQLSGSANGGLFCQLCHFVLVQNLQSYYERKRAEEFGSLFCLCRVKCDVS